MLWTKSDYRDTFTVSRSALMKLSHIRSYMTYHKCIGQLRDFGYISYLPSYHPARGSAIVMLF
ncbi:hypothetical protein SAMN05216464_113159 [Mucilaginibacter pineti]|uniref:Uncharacterized protein n=2 Tax=Mucilaginibacter pineti TaxID=1391627 RepID=A0A1G7ITP7_9SPHI|nr:hypothetical protein SAMN05216464_113159 [Mucilaginibacter pineti]